MYTFKVSRLYSASQSPHSRGDKKKDRVDGARLKRSGSSKFFFNFIKTQLGMLLILAFNSWNWLDSVISLCMGRNGLTFLESAKENN